MNPYDAARKHAEQNVNQGRGGYPPAEASELVRAAYLAGYRAAADGATVSVPGIEKK